MDLEESTQQSDLATVTQGEKKKKPALMKKKKQF